MGKGYNNFMCKKPFHPGSRDNMKRVWMAEQRTEKDKQREEELRQQYEKEQDLYNNRLLVSTESRDKLSLNFMYEIPSGADKPRDRDDDTEYKFEWQRNAPRESFAKDKADIHDQPFGIQVKHVRCLKCHQWGHLNTDSECPLNKTGSTRALIQGSSTSTAPSTSVGSDPKELMKEMKEEVGLTLKRSLAGQVFENEKLDERLAASNVDPEVAFLLSLSKKEKKKMLKKLNFLTGSNDKVKKKKEKDREKHSRKRSRSSSESMSSDRKDDDTKKSRHEPKYSHRKHPSTSTSSRHHYNEEKNNRECSRSRESRHHKHDDDDYHSSKGSRREHEHGRHDSRETTHQSNRSPTKVKKEEESQKHHQDNVSNKPRRDDGHHKHERDCSSSSRSDRKESRSQRNRIKRES